MIRHAVFFRFKEQISETDEQRHIGDFASLPVSIEQIAGYEWGRVIAGPDSNGTPEYHVAHYLVFRDVNSLREYIDHPAHQRFIERNRTSWDSVTVVDSEQ